MNDDRNRSQIIRVDARNCFVESLNDAFEIGKAHFTFASYDLSKPSGQRQTNSIQIYIDMAEVLELCRKLVGGELRYLMQAKKKNGMATTMSGRSNTFSNSEIDDLTSQPFVRSAGRFISTGDGGRHQRRKSQ